jgi:hypothetical protein
MATKYILKSLYVLMTLVTSSLALGQDATAQRREVNLTGIELSFDHRCPETLTQPDLLCRSSGWALASGRTTYLLYGDKNILQAFQRKRVSISGVLEEEPIAEYGTQTIRRRIAVRSVESSELTRDAIETLVNQLKVVPWRRPENHCSPMCWDFAFTDPMIQILQAGTGAQGVLLDHISDHDIQDQVVMLLGGVGDENAILPIIETLSDGNETTLEAKSNRLNLVGNLALTNLTVSEVIWHHGGGIPLQRCPTTPKSCWLAWWFHQKAFKVGIGGDRLYVNYPNYGIYAQF